MKLFVDKSIEIDAPPAKVWATITDRKYTDRWAPEFANGEPFTIESEWHLDSTVLWKDKNGEVAVRGKVTRVWLDEVLRFTVRDANTTEGPKLSDQDGITFELTPKEGSTVLHVLQGDFSVMADAEKYYQMTVSVWDRVLPKIKSLAEV